MKQIIAILLAIAFASHAVADYLGSHAIDGTLTWTTQTHDSTGAQSDADSAPTYRIYEDETGTPILTGTMALLDDANTTGFYSEQITLSAANGFEQDKSYHVRVAATVGGVTAAERHYFQVGAYTQSDVVKVSGSTTAADNAEIVFDTDFAANYDATDDRWLVEIDTGGLAFAGFAADAIRASVIADDVTTELLAVSALLEADSGSTTTLVDAALTQGDDYWNGATVEFTSGTLDGVQVIVDDFDAATDTLTFQRTLPATVAAGHFYRILRSAAFPETEPYETSQLKSDNDATKAVVDDILVDTAEIGVDGAGLTEAGGTGDHLTAIDLPDQTMNITGNITGNLSGSVGSVTGSVGSISGVTFPNNFDDLAITATTGLVSLDKALPISSVYWGDYVDNDQVIDFKFSTSDTLTGGTVVIYEDGSLTEITTAETLTADFDGVTGLNNLAVDLLDAGFVAGRTYKAVLTAGTVDGLSVAGQTVGTWHIERYSSAADVWTVATRELTSGQNIILVKDTGVTGFNDLSAAQVNTEVDTALAEIHLDHLLAADYDPAAKPGVATALLNELIESDAGVSRFTANALEQAPSGGGTADWTADERTAMRSILGIPASGTTPDDPTTGILDTIRDDTNELQTDWVNGGRLDLLIDAILADTTVIGTFPDLSSGATLAGNLEDMRDNGTEAFDRATDSLQAIRDRGDSSWTGTGGGPVEHIPVPPSRTLLVRSRGDGTFGVVGRIRMRAGETLWWAVDLRGTQLAAGDLVDAVAAPTLSGAQAANMTVPDYGVFGTLVKFQCVLSGSATTSDTINVELSITPDSGETLKVTVPVTVGS